MGSVLKGGSGKGLYVGYRTQPTKAQTYADIIFSTTDNRIHCPYCNGTKFEVKGGDSIDDGELPTYMDGYGAAGQLNMAIFLCAGCGREFAKNLATNGEWTEQV